MITYHTYPLNDLKEHITNGSVRCWCNPDDNEEGLVKHNSLDRRELYENLPIQ